MRRASASEIKAVLTALSATPKQIARIARGRSRAQLHRKPAADAWSAQEIVAHLRACAEVWSGSIERMLAQDHPTIRYVSPRGWIKKTDYLEQDFRDSLRAFSERRALTPQDPQPPGNEGLVAARDLHRHHPGTRRQRSELRYAHRRSRGWTPGPASPDRQLSRGSVARPPASLQNRKLAQSSGEPDGSSERSLSALLSFRVIVASRSMFM